MTGAVRRLARDERGAALAAVILLLLVGSVVGVTTLQLAMHADEATGVDRERGQAVQAAEAGAHRAINRLRNNPGCDTEASDPVELTDGDEVVGSYRVRIDPEPGTGCDTDVRVVHAWGYGGTGGERSMRRLRIEVELIPQEGFQFTLFAAGPDGVVQAKNTASVDGDIYAESLDETQNNVIADRVITPGSIRTKDNAAYSGTLWAGADISLGQNADVGGSVVAAGSAGAGDIVLENGVEVARNVQAAGTVTLPTNYSVGGFISEDEGNLAPPPSLEKPTFTWDPANYDPAPETFDTADELSGALESDQDALAGTYYTDDASGTVEMPRRATVSGPLTIVTPGEVAMGRSLRSAGGSYPVVVVSDGTDGAIHVDQPGSYDASLDLLLYSPGTVEVLNRTTMRGAVYADEIRVKNRFAISRSSALAADPPPGFDFSQSATPRFLVAPLEWREVVPEPPS